MVRPPAGRRQCDTGSLRGLAEPVENLPPVSTTAVGVAAIRAAEAARPDALFEDPIAAKFVRASGATYEPRTAAADSRVARVITWVRVRTRFLDDLLRDAAAGGCRQVVLLGAGLDARAFRLDWPAGTTLFELDLPGILAFKERVVASEHLVPACARAVVPSDLTGDWQHDLRASGFDPARATTWVTEGLLVYLPEAEREALVDAITASSTAGSRWGLTLASADQQPRPDAPGATGESVDAAVPARDRDYMALWQSEAPADLHDWLGTRGWDLAVADAYERGVSYGLPVTPNAQTRRHARLIDARRR